MQNLIDISALDKQEISKLLKLATQFKTDQNNFIHDDIYPDKTVGSLFFEPSTRTKLSFQVATKNLGARFIDIHYSETSLQKGESIEDTIEAISLMGIDVLIIRHQQEVLKDLAIQFPNIKFINAGEGTSSHPTQALTDYMTMSEFSTNPDNLDISIVGDLDHSRVAASFIELLKIVGFKRLRLAGLPELCKNYQNNNFEYFDNLNEALRDSELIMALRIQNERLNKELSIKHTEYISRYQITLDSLRFANKDFLLFHPGPVNWGIQLEKTIANIKNCKITNQVINGVAIRMAILSNIFSS